MPSAPVVDGHPLEDPFVLPTSYAQQRLWLLDQLEPGNTAFNLSRAYRLTGPLDVTALEQGLNAILQRHESLRTTFGTVDGQSVQFVAPSVALTLPRVDLQGLPENDRESEASRLATAEALRPFDLSRGPLLRVCLYRLDKEDHVLLTVMHHIITDGWSMAVFYRELAALYRGLCTERIAPLPELPVQYADYAVWQQEWLRGDRLESLLAYWRGQLGTGLAVLQLPTLRPRPAMQTYGGTRHRLSLPEGVTGPLRALARQERATLYMTLLAAFNTLLFRYTGQRDIVVGSPIAGRTRVEIEGLIGFFVNMLVLRTDLSGNPSFREVLRRVRAICLGAYAHQDLPFERLVEELRPERDASRHPLFQVTFALQNTPRQDLELYGLDARQMELEKGHVRFDLEVHFRETAGGLEGRFIYNTDLFDAVTIARMADHYGELVGSIVATEESPDRPISELALMTEEERHRILVEWNGTPTGYPRGSCVHELFEEQARQRPGATAVEWGERQWTYRELDERANQLAQHLRSLGAGPEVLVGLCLERSPEMVAGMLGILKAGGAYVPLDPNDPAGRLAFVLEDTRAPVVLTQKRLCDGLPAGPAVVICLDGDWATSVPQGGVPQGGVPQGGVPEGGENLANLTGPANLATVIYTSGSTGRAKGVAVPHQAIVRLVRDTDYVHLGPADRIAQASTATFDAATFEVWGALLNGACLVGVGSETVLSPHDLVAHLQNERINVLFMTTALFNELAATVPDAFQGLRDLLFGGEAVSPRWVRKVLTKGPPERMLHVYGPTENATFTTWHLVSAVEAGAETVPIGRPIANTQIYVLDGNLQPVPVGTVGELWIGGDGLARDYVRRPGLTAERFVPNPFAGTPGARLYRTGDLVRYRESGDLEFLGRYDHQVKLRGFRIELGEIETVLGRHPAVAQTVVVVRKDRPGDGQLAAYVVPDRERAPAGSGLRLQELHNYLGERLPDYMLPSAIVPLDSFPLTPGGKVDRLALPQPGRSSLASETRFVAPGDALELCLARIWEELLGVEPLGLRDNFFQLGGHSLLAIQLFSRLENELGQKLPVAMLFQAPTIEQLASAIRQEDLSIDWSTLVPIQAKGSRPPFFCVHGFGGGVLDYAELARLLGPDQPFYGLQARGRDGIGEPHAQIEDMAAYYIAAIRAVQPEGPYCLGGYCYGGVVAFEMTRQLHDQGERVGLLAILEGYAPRGREAREPLWHPDVLGSFLRNLPYWLRDTLQREGWQERLRTSLRRRARHGPWGEVREWDADDAHRAIEDVVGDTSALSEPHLKVIEVHHRAMKRYRPQVYAGRATLFRVRASTLLRAHDPEMGWGRLAAGGVDVRIIPGAHYTILTPPSVEGLATELKASLEQVGEDRQHRD